MLGCYAGMGKGKYQRAPTRKVLEEMAQHQVAKRSPARDRDRFIAFSFAAADVVFELDTWGNIQFAGGATQWLLHETESELIGQSILDKVDSDQRALLKAVMNQCRILGRANATVIRFGDEATRFRTATVYGTYLPEYPDSVYLSIQSGRPRVIAADLGDATKDKDTGLLDADSFAKLATELAVSQPEACANLFMTLMELQGFESTRESMDEESERDFVENIVAYLQALSVDGTFAGRLEDDKFGLIHDGNLDQEAVIRGLKEQPFAENLKVETVDLPIDSHGMSEKDIARALAYTIKEFAEENEEFTLTSLAGAYTDMLSETKEKLQRFQQTVANGEFDIHLQPIIHLETGKVHHYEALSRLHELGPDASPFQFITFAEDVGVIGDFDLAVCRKAIAQVQYANQHSGKLSVAINVSGRSLKSDIFVDELMALLLSCSEIRSQLMFELTESSQIKNLERTNEILKKLRQLGHAVCLDDFGAGAAGYQYLRQLETDYVKIDGVYVHEAEDSQSGRAFLKSMARLCQDLDIATIGECVETNGQAELLKDIGVQYAQGFLFGRPELRVSGVCEPFKSRSAESDLDDD